MLKIFSSDAIQQIDAYTIANEPISSIDLMERAANVLANRIFEGINPEHKIKIFIGPGNNGGDGLAVARLLNERNVDVQVFRLTFFSNFSPDNLKNLERLDPKLISTIENEQDFPEIHENDLIIDALFGSGLNKSLENCSLKLVEFINNQKATVISIDVPSGLSSDKAMDKNSNAIRANYTLSLENYKLSFLFPESAVFVGDIEVLPIGLNQNIMAQLVPSAYVLTEVDVRLMLKPRAKFSHKGSYGHAFLIVGSKEKMGAALLSSKAALKSGVGLLTTHIPTSGLTALNCFLPEAMASVDSMDFLSELPNFDFANAVGVGPGIGMNKQSAATLKLLIQECKVPLVLDADALNILSENKTWVAFLPKNSILTPHPKEFERLFGKTENSFDRIQLQSEMSRKYQLIIVYKGANTCISLPNGKLIFNLNGNPGMATAGTGDVLTGIILSFLAQEYSSEESAQLGVFLHGLAGDLAANELGFEAMLATDLIDKIHAAFKQIYNSTLI